MKCLYCGKGIGPIRQLRDLEFCREAHRNQFRERYRQQLYEALAPDPAPAPIAGFRERPPATGSPAPTALLRALPRSVPGGRPPAMRTEAAGVSVERPAWMIGQRLAAMPMRLAWQSSAAALRSSNPTVSFSMVVQPPDGSAAGAASTHLMAGTSAARPLAAAPRISGPKPSPPSMVSLPAAAQIPTPGVAEPASPQLHAVIPTFCDPAAIGPVPPAIQQAALPRSTAVARPPAPPELWSGPEAGLSPAAMACQLRPLAPARRARADESRLPPSSCAPPRVECPAAAAVPARPAPAAATKAAPSWEAARALSPDRPLVPLADIVLPEIDRLPAPAGAAHGLGLALRSDLGRAVRSCAVLWTLRVAHVCNPPFRMEPVRVRFNDLVQAGRTAPYGPDLLDRRAPKTNPRLFVREVAPLSRRQKWQYIGAAAAALLLAGVLRPKVAPTGLGGSVPWRGIAIRQWISQRATHTFADNFRGGLDQWKGVRPAWPKSWSYSTDGFIHPGQLALYRPSAPLSDYRFQFMAQVENKSVDWVVRARDADNYYAVKFAILQPGPRPIVAMVRYPVVGGRRGTRVQTPLRMMIHANTPYRVTVDVQGNRFRAYIEDQQADFWTDDRLQTGGVGFFSEAGEHARVYWVKLETHGDMLGRVCGLLSGNGSEGATNKETQAMDYRHAGTTDTNAAPGPGGAEAAARTAQETRISRVLSKAASLHLDGKLDEAAKELSRAVDGGERHPAVYFALGQLQYELRQYGPAAQSYTQTALLQPLHPTAFFNAGVCLGRSERWEEAAAAFRKSISNDPARTEAHLALGACLVQLGLHNEALDAYDRFLERHPDHEEALFGKAVALQKRERSSEAVELYRRILNRNPHSEEALSNLVSLALSNQDYEQVRRYAQLLAELRPKSQIALEGLAGAAFAAGDHKAAADYSRKLAELAPQSFENWFNLGVACHKAGDLANASEAYARATRVQPASPQAHLNLGVALQEQGDHRAARAAYERALEIDPQLAGVHWNLGLVHEQLGDLAAAEKLYAQVPEGSPDSDDAAFRIGHLRLERADYPGSIQAFETCLEKRPTWPEARLNLGIAHWRAGDKEAARTCFQELTASGADSKEALRGLAALSLEHQDYDKAFEIYRQLLDSGDRSAELLYNAGLICQKRGEPEDAAVLYREALKAAPQFGEALLNLGHALMSLGNEFEARSCWRKAVIAKPELAQRYFEPAAQAS